VAASDPVRFVGSVDALEALVPLESARRRDISVQVRSVRGEEVAPRVLTAPAGTSWTTVRLLMPGDTPPGDYEATVGVGKEQLAAVVQVPEQPRLHLHPETIDVEVAPGGAATVSVTVTNSGNAAVRVPRAAVVGLFEVGGLDNAIGYGLMSDASGVDRLGVVADHLAENHGGLLRLSVRSGSGAVGPGTSKTLTCELRPSGSVVEGHTYFGYWRLADVTATVHLRVVAASGSGPESDAEATVTELSGTTPTASTRGASKRTTSRTRKDTR